MSAGRTAVSPATHSSASADDGMLHYECIPHPEYSISPLQTPPQGFPAGPPRLVTAGGRHPASPVSACSAADGFFCASPPFPRATADVVGGRQYGGGGGMAHGSVASFDSCKWDTEAAVDACDGDSYWDVDTPAPGPPSPALTFASASDASADPKKRRAAQGSPSWAALPPPAHVTDGELSVKEAGMVAQCLAAAMTLPQRARKELLRALADRSGQQPAETQQRAATVPRPVPSAGVGGASHVTFLIDTEEYYAGLLYSLSRAQRSIVMMGWMFSHLTYLCRSQPLRQQARLDNLLQQKAREGIRIRILLSTEFGDAYDQENMRYVRSSRSSAYALEMLHPNIAVRTDGIDSLEVKERQCAPGREKLVVVDGRVCFFGGMDCTVGNYDTRQHPCTLVEPDRWVGRDYSNPKVDGLALEPLLEGRKMGDPFGTDMPRGYAAAARQPGHGLMAVASGPIAADLQRHFERRWVGRWRPAKRVAAETAAVAAVAVAAAAGPAPQTFARKPPAPAVPPKYHESEPVYPPQTAQPSGPLQCSLHTMAPSAFGGHGETESLLSAVVAGAQRFLYLETRWLLLPPGRALLGVLVERLARAMVNSDDPFRCYIVLPLFADAGPASHTGAVQMHAVSELQSAVNARAGEIKTVQPEKAVRRELRQVLVLCGLQSFGRSPVSGRLLTEQTTVHHLLMIADDRVSVLGSAHLVRASLDPDCPGAVHDYLVKLEDAEEGTTLRELRDQLWREHLWECGAVLSPEESAAVADPGSDAAWELWTGRAAANSVFLSEVFPRFPNPRNFRVASSRNQRAAPDKAAPTTSAPASRPPPAPTVNASNRGRSTSLLGKIQRFAGKREQPELQRRLATAAAEQPAAQHQPAAGGWRDQAVGDEAAVDRLHRVRGQLVLWPFSSVSQEILQGWRVTAAAEQSA